MKIKNMELGWISVYDLARSKQFFTETLGLELGHSNEAHGWLELKTATAGFWLGVGKYTKEANGPIVPGSNTVLTMTVDDLLATKAELEAKKVVFVGEILEIPGHVKMALFQDPDGNHFQLVERLDDRIKV